MALMGWVSTSPVAVLHVGGLSVGSVVAKTVPAASPPAQRFVAPQLRAETVAEVTLSPAQVPGVLPTSVEVNTLPSTSPTMQTSPVVHDPDSSWMPDPELESI